MQLAQVEEAITDTAHAHRAFDVVCDPYQAVGLMQRLNHRGLHVLPFTFSQASAGTLALTLHTLLRSRALALPDDPELIDELAHGRLRKVSPTSTASTTTRTGTTTALSIALVAERLLAQYQFEP